MGSAKIHALCHTESALLNSMSIARDGISGWPKPFPLSNRCQYPISSSFLLRPFHRSVFAVRERKEE
jgi:hypothetical protein